MHPGGNILYNTNMERDRQNRFDKEELAGGQLDRLSAVVRVDTSFGGPGMRFIGWDAQGKPLIASTIDRLSSLVKESIDTYRKARLPLPRVSYDKINPVSFSYVGNTIHYKEQNGFIGEDLLVYGVQNEKGENDSISLGEYSVLDAVARVKETMWQDIDPTAGVNITPSSMYTLFIENNDRGKDATALLFKPTSLQRSNAPTFAAFLQDTVINLLNIERLSQPDKRKGYLDAVNEITQDVNKKTSKFSKFLNLFVEVDDAKAERIKHDMMNLGRRLKLFEIESSVPGNPAMPVLDLGSMDLDTLLMLATRMRDKARHALR